MPEKGEHRAFLKGTVVVLALPSIGPPGRARWPLVAPNDICSSFRYTEERIDTTHRPRGDPPICPDHLRARPKSEAPN